MLSFVDDEWVAGKGTYPQRWGYPSQQYVLFLGIVEI